MFSTALMEDSADFAQDDQVVHGKVKWFDAVKGFGFVVADTGGPDILLHANVLRNFGQGSIADTSAVELRVQETERGYQAIEVISVTPPAIADAGTGPAVPDDVSEIELTPARVKWFDKAKGFGFANSYGDSGDIFLHIEVLHRCGLADLQAGEAICLRIIDGDRGMLAAEVHPWDFAVDNG